MNRFCWSKVAVLLLLNILCWTNIASGQLAVNPASVNFGNVPTGTSASQALILSNPSKSDMTVSQAMVSGSGFSLRGPSLPLTLAAGKAVTLNLMFAPRPTGSASGSLSLTGSITSIHDRSKKHNTVSMTTTAVSMSGTGSTPSSTIAAPGVLAAYPSSLGFAALQIGSSQTLSATVTNSGGIGRHHHPGHNPANHHHGQQFHSEWDEFAPHAGCRSESDLQRNVCASIGRKRRQ